ncbi:MAG: 2-isopropylmalate synthase [Clostridia bacterium]|nr:2-isopropylmalate synthase [Clostridia bacterium]
MEINMNYKKYKRQYFDVPISERSWIDNKISKAPIWCSVDLRDGNQALYSPLSTNEKIEFFKFLVKLGFKEIEVGFPAASDTEFEFVRKLIDEKIIPDDVTIQVLTQAREHIIAKTIEAVKGAKNIIIHLYNSTSEVQRRVVFGKSKDEILELAVLGAKEVVQAAESELDGNVRYEYSPESFTCTEPEYALEVCNAVLDVFKPTVDKKAIINLPSTIEISTPNIYADQVEYINKNLRYRDKVILSVHAHNDRGTGIAATELGLLAGADRVEGTVFGNGERTGNADIITVALNMFCQGVDPGLSIDNIDEIIDIYEKFIHIPINPRHPYAGDMAYVAFSGSHQDAIRKSFAEYEKSGKQYWQNPYLTIDPTDIGRVYEPIKINSQSGKGGVGYIMENKFGLILPKELLVVFAKQITNLSDQKQTVLEPSEIYDIFVKEYINITEPYKLDKYTFETKDDGTVIHAVLNGTQICAKGNGPIDALCEAVNKYMGTNIEIFAYSEHALERRASSKAVSYIAVKLDDKIYWGAGVDSNINTSSMYAYISAINKIVKK